MFEDVTIFQATLAAVQAICTWISQLHAKQQKIRQLGQTVQALSMVLEPLRQPSPSLDLDRNVLALLYDLLEILNGVRDHLSLWGGKMKKSKFISVLGFLNPSIALGMLSDDEKKVSQWINLFMLSLQIAILRKQVGVQRMEPRVSETMRLGESWVLYNEDVSAFWSKQVGEEKVFLSSAEFITSLEEWLGEDLGETMRNGVLLELDRQDIGGVTRKALERFAGKRTLKICIEDLRLQYDANDSTPVSPTIPSNDLVPTLVWTDDEVENIKEGLDHATSRGIRVIQLPSTATTKLWIEQNEDEIRALEKCNLIQFITDNVRWEVNDQNDNGLGHVAKGPSLNLSAGESVLRYLRGRGFKAPVLVYCGGSLRLTHYVMAYSRAASTCFDEICDAFIDRLVEARADRAKEEKRLVYDDEYDEFWAGYRKMEGYNLEPSF